MIATKKYPEEALKTWGKAKELRQKYFSSYAKAHETGGLCFAGSAGSFNSIQQAFGRDVYILGSEPYAAGAANFGEFASKCQYACESRGIARDLCGYMKNYWGGIFLNKFLLPDHTTVPWPKPDLSFTHHMCCSHAKWYQYSGEIEGGVPLFGIDLNCKIGSLMTDRDLDYMHAQMMEGIEWMEKVTGRKFDDELFIESALNEFASNSAWGEAYACNQAIPAPIDEKRIYSYFPFNMLCPQWNETPVLFRELRDELRDRVKRGIAAVGNERFRILTDGPPQWAMLELYGLMEKVYGAVTLGSIYTAYWGTGWDTAEDGSLVPSKIPSKEEFSRGNREERVRKYIDWKMKRQEAYSVIFTGCHQRKSQLLLKVMKLWKMDGIIIHLNRGCESSALGVLENRLDVLKAGYPVLTYEGNMGDVRDFDLAGTVRKIENFFENLGLEKLSEGV